jgi:ABC-2 type transport system ATP-binding protein
MTIFFRPKTWNSLSSWKPELDSMEVPVSMAIQASGLARTSGWRRTSLPTDELVDGTLSVPYGVIFGILGPHCQAKSTLLQILLGIVQPTAGTAMILGYELATQARQIRLHTGALMAHDTVYECLSAQDNLDYFGRIWRLPAATRNSRAQELLSLLGLWEHRKELPKHWPPLFKKKLALARALIHRPSLLLIEEPTTLLDPTSAAEFRSDLQRMAIREELTMLVALSRIEEADELCSLVSFLRDGVVGHTVPVVQPYNNGSHTRLEITGRGFTPGVVALLQKRHDVLSVNTAQNRLMIELSDQADTAPIIALLVEASADVEEVHRN